MQWDGEKIRRTAWATTFKRGWRAWLALVTVCFLFSFVGAVNTTQTSFVDVIDGALGLSDEMMPKNVDILIDYAASLPALQDLLGESPESFANLVDSITRSSGWLIRLLALNPAYLARNPGEALFNVVLVALITSVIHFCVRNVIAIGQVRYVQETRFSAEVPWRRMLAPFHLHTLLNMVRVMVCYHTVLLLWSLTIVGGVYKIFQYAMVPYLLAENPRITWAEARGLSTRMTDGHKWEMFLTSLSWWYVYLLKAVPIVGLLFSTPLLAELDAEYYFVTRGMLLRGEGVGGSDLFVEDAFSGEAWTLLDERQRSLLPAPTYVLEDLDVEPPVREEGQLAYPLVEIVYLFFIFCFIGWVWEVGLHFVQAHEFANRGTLYGPWIPIYGFGGVGIVVGLDRFKSDPKKLFAMAVCLCAALEYASSLILDFMFNSSYWDYSDMVFNVNGRICLAGLLAFGIGGLFGVYVAAPAIASKVRKLPRNVQYGGAIALTVAFCVDLGYCLLNGFNSGAGVGEKL